jgi:uncharacterized OsmC-like protein
MIYSIAESLVSSKSSDVKVGKHLIKVSNEGEINEFEEYIESSELFAAGISSSICSAIKKHIANHNWEVKFIHVGVSIFETESNSNSTYFHCDVKLNGKLSPSQLQELNHAVQAADVYKMLNSKLELSLELS